MNHKQPKRRPFLALALGLGLGLASCSNFKAVRTSETGGTFTSTGRAFTFLSWDMPRSALQIAQDNAADSGRPNVVVTKTRVTDWGVFDWVLEIIGSRSAEVRGTWGY